MKRLLCIMSAAMNRGGAETFLMKLYRKIDKTEYQMDFCVSANDKGIYDDEILSMGGKIFKKGKKTDGLIKSFNTIKRTVKENNYEYVIRVNEHSLSTIDLIAAKCGGAKVVAMRSSNAASGSKIRTVLHKLFMPLAKCVPDVKIAPSSEAAKYTFGKKSVKKGKVNLLHNAIEVDNYLFNSDMRNRLRDELNLNGKFVVGHIGRFANQKNHSFLIDVFYGITKKCDNAHLVLVGEGDLKPKIEEKVNSLNISDKVSFLGVRNDVPKLLSAFDVKLFPSLYEGMPNTIIEAQASGLHCVISDTITKEADITGLVDYLPLSGDTQMWADKVLSYKNYERKSMKEVFVKEGYDIASVVDKFTEIIFN